MTPVVLFDEGWGNEEEAALTHWFFENGAVVAEGDLIAEVMLGKAAIEVRAPVGGSLKILVPSDSVVAKGATLAVIRDTEALG